MHAIGRLMIASVGSTIAGSARSSKRTSRAPYNTAPCISHLSFVLLVGDVFEPIHRLAIELLLHGDVRHRRGGRRAMPVLFARGKPDDVTGSNLFNGSAPALDAARPGCHDQRLAERMGVPGGARAGLECHGRTRSSGGSGGLKERIDTDGAGKPVTGSFRGRLRTCSSDLHRKVPFNVLSTPQNLAESPEKTSPPQLAIAESVCDTRRWGDHHAARSVRRRHDHGSHLR